MRLRFGDCLFDGQTRELRRAGRLVHVQPKVFALLEILLARRPGAVSKDELTAALWPGTFVADGNLARVAANLREAVGDDGQTPRFVRTVARFGYAFHGEAVPEADLSRGEAPCILIRDEQEIALKEGENILGRDPAADVAVEDASVSRHHARIVVQGVSVHIEDLGSKNGTFVGDRRLDAGMPLRDGDAIRLGKVCLVFHRLLTGASTESVVES